MHGKMRLCVLGSLSLIHLTYKIAGNCPILWNAHSSLLDSYSISVSLHIFHETLGEHDKILLPFTSCRIPTGYN